MNTTNMQSEDLEVANLMGEYLERLRKEKGLSLRKLAKLSGVSHSCIYKFEKGHTKNIQINNLLPISDALNADITLFLAV